MSTTPDDTTTTGIFDGWLPSREDAIKWGEGRLGIDEDTKKDFQASILEGASALWDNLLGFFGIANSNINSVFAGLMDWIADLRGSPTLTGLTTFADNLKAGTTPTATAAQSALSGKLTHGV